MDPNKLVIREYAQRVNSACEEIPLTRGLALENYALKDDKDCPPIVVAMRKLVEIKQSTWKQWVEEYTPVVMNKSKWREVWLLFTRNRYFFYEYNKITNMISSSIVYGSRDQAMYAYNNHDIFWVDVYPIEDGLRVPAL
jgi:hypothetical protein